MRWHGWHGWHGGGRGAGHAKKSVFHRSVRRRRQPSVGTNWVDQGYTGNARAWVECKQGWSVAIVSHPWRSLSRSSSGTPGGPGRR
jgi:hypothetical protein